MILTDFDDFKAELKQLCAVLGKSYTDSLGSGYWRALKEIEFREFKAHVDRVLKSASKETKFPRPCDLQDHPPAVTRSGEADSVFRQAEEACARNWDQRLKADPEFAGVELAIAKTDRILGSEWEGSAIYATALDENRRYRNQLQLLRDCRRKSPQ